MSGFAQYFLPAPSGGSSSGSGSGSIFGPGGVLISKPRVRRWIDAATRDYVVQQGGLEQDYGFTSKAVLAFATRLGSCQVDPGFGSRLHEVKQADERGRRLAEAYGLLALAHLKSEVQDLKVTATLPKGRPGVIELVASARVGPNTVSAKYTVGL